MEEKVRKLLDFLDREQVAVIYSGWVWDGEHESHSVSVDEEATEQLKQLISNVESELR